MSIALTARESVFTYPFELYLSLLFNHNSTIVFFYISNALYLLATVVVGSSEETLANVVSEEKFEQKMVLSSMSALHC